MAKKPLPCPTLLRLLLTYEPETGKLFWKERKSWMFRPSRRYSTSRLCSAWNKKHAGTEAGADDGNGYRRICINLVRIKSHRAVWAIHNGTWPLGEVDHINRCRDDNRIDNLRDVSRAVNLKNKKRYSNNTSGRPGVYWFSASNEWRASIPVDGRNKHLGSFASFYAACMARKLAEKKYGYSCGHGGH